MTISAMQLADVASRRGRSAAWPAVLVVLNFCAAWVVATVITEHAPSDVFALGIFIGAWVLSFAAGMTLTAAASGRTLAGALGAGAGWSIGTAALFFLEFWIAAGFLVAGVYTNGITILLYFPAAALVAFLAIRRYVRRQSRQGES